MKKIFVYRINKREWYNIFKIYIYKLIGYKVLVWGEHDFLSCAYENMIFQMIIFDGDMYYKKYPNNIAVTTNETSFTYQEFFEYCLGFSKIAEIAVVSIVLILLC